MTFIENATLSPISLRVQEKDSTTGRTFIKEYTVPAGKLVSQGGIIMLTHQKPETFGRIDIDADDLKRLLGNTNILLMFACGKLRSPMYKPDTQKIPEPDIEERAKVKYDLKSKGIDVDVKLSGSGRENRHTELLAPK